MTGLILTVILGMGYSGIYPMIITLTGRAFRSSAAVGIVTTGAGLGSFLFPFLFSGIAQALGLRTGFLMLAALPAGISAIAIVLIVRHSRRGDRPASLKAGLDFRLLLAVCLYTTHFRFK